MIVSSMTSKARTTIPRPVRTALGLHPGDRLAYRIDGDRVIVTKTGAAPRLAPFATFDEWNSEADRRAYADF